MFDEQQKFEFVQEVAYYMAQSIELIKRFDFDKIIEAIDLLHNVQHRSNQVCVVGLGGSAATGSHFVNDLRKMNGIAAYTPLDNVAELTAYINDESWETSLVNSIKTSHKIGDIIFILSTSGGGKYGEKSKSLCAVADWAKQNEVPVISITSYSDCYIARKSDVNIAIHDLPYVSTKRLSVAHTEGLTSVVLHCIVNHDALKKTGL